MGRRRETTGRKEREGVLGREGGKGAEEKFSCGEKQMRKAESVNDCARESRSGRKPFAF